jgi:GDPmannose 4,6-dehydratase
VAAYREHYGAFACNAYFYTNESPRRSPEFLLRKVTRAVAEIVAGKRRELVLGNLETVRDWGWAPEYAELAIAILEAERPDDFIVATGEGHSVRELVQLAFGLVSLDWQKYVRVDESLVRPSEPAPLIGDSSKLRRVVGRGPDVKLDAVVRRLLAHDLQSLGISPVPF